MKKCCLALVLTAAARALGQEQAPIQQPENIYFADDFIAYESKDTLRWSLHRLSGAGAVFSGRSTMSTVQDIGSFGSTGIKRTYHDGIVNLDQRKVLVDDGTGKFDQTSVGAASDGKTNTWSITNSSQIDAESISLHTYSADMLDGGPRSKKAQDSYGMELGIKHDMPGKVLSRWGWTMFGGLSINGLNSKMTSTEKAMMTTITDTYSLDGAAPPDLAPYSSPSTNSVGLTDADGNPILGSDGGQGSVFQDTSILLPQDPMSRTTATTEVANVTNDFHLKGAYFTMRAGPTFELPLGRHLRGSLSGGAAVVYSGSVYSVKQTFQPDTGAPVIETVASEKIKLLPGFYADASVEYVLTDRASLYLSAGYQNSGSYRQNIVTDTANYTTKVDLKSLQGVNMGMSIRF